MMASIAVQGGSYFRAFLPSKGCDLCDLRPYPSSVNRSPSHQRALLLPYLHDQPSLYPRYGNTVPGRRQQLARRIGPTRIHTRVATDRPEASFDTPACAADAPRRATMSASALRPVHTAKRTCYPCQPEPLITHPVRKPLELPPHVAYVPTSQPPCRGRAPAYRSPRDGYY